jgi:hypothetical protein
MLNRFARKAGDMKTKAIKIDYLARVEGEGGLCIKIRDSEVVEVKLKIFEPPRFLRPSFVAVISLRFQILPQGSAESVRLLTR